MGDLQPACLRQLNAKFGTNVRTHPKDARYFIGRGLQDLWLAFIPGVKAVQIDNIIPPHLEKKAHRFRNHLTRAFRRIAEPTYEDVRTASRGYWHSDSAPIACEINDQRLNASVLILSRFKGRGTLLSLGTIKSERTDIHPIDPDLIRTTTVEELPLLSCVAFTVSYPASRNETIALLSEFALLHSQPFEPSPEGRLTSVDQYNRTFTPHHHYVPG